MTKSLLIVPGHAEVGLLSVMVGLYQACHSRGVKVGVLHIAQDPKDSTRLQKLFPNSQIPELVLRIKDWQRAVNDNKLDEVLTHLLFCQQKVAGDYDLLLIKGMGNDISGLSAEDINKQIARTLRSKIILLTTVEDPSDLESQLYQEIKPYQNMQQDSLLGIIFNKVGSPHYGSKQKIDLSAPAVDSADTELLSDKIKSLPFFKEQPNLLLGVIPWARDFYAPRVSDIASFLQADIIKAGDMEVKRVHRVKLCARMVHHVLHVLEPQTLLVTAGDRGDILLAAAVATTKGINISGLVMTGRYQLDSAMINFCSDAFSAGLPLLQVSTDSYETVSRLRDFHFKIAANDQQRIEIICASIMENIDIDKVLSGVKEQLTAQHSPALFQYQLTSKAKHKLQRIVLPEGEEPRTVQAALSCAAQGIAHVVMLGDVDVINKIAQRFNLKINDHVEIISPKLIREQYVAPLVAKRSHKGVTEVMARESLRSNIMLATMMLEQGHVDGLVSGAVHTTAHTIRPALQVIKTAPEFNLVSSLFFMCLPEQVLVFADCAINPDPNAEQLAEIAIQSADTANSFGISPKIAMLSYSTGESGSGADVDKVQKATTIVRSKRPDLVIDGPLQYDAAIIKSVAQQKAPDSTVAGQATVLIFPDLNTGNTTYKAVQRSAGIISIGPVLQGLNKPVNDLSRGSTIKDIIYTIAITSIQAQGL